MNHFADPDFWFYYRQLPNPIRNIADKNFKLLKSDPRHVCVRLEKVGVLYSARIGLNIEHLPESAVTGCNGFGLALTRHTSA